MTAVSDPLRRAAYGALLLALFLILSPPAHAQNPFAQLSLDVPSPVVNQANVNASYSFPMGDFGDIIGRNASGVEFYVARRVPTLPAYVGLDIDLASYGSESFEVVLGETSEGTASYTVTTQSLFFQPHLSLRYEPAGGALRPFGEMLIGVNVLATNTSIDGSPTVVPGALENRSSWTFSAGIGGGLDYRILHIESEGVVTGLTASLHYVYGGNAGIPTAEDGDLTDDESALPEASTSVLQPELGLYFDF